MATTQNYFDKNAANFDKRTQQRLQMVNDFSEKLVNNVLDNTNSDKVSLMDFGTGTGSFGIEVVKRLEGKVNFAVFADLSSEMLKKCQTNAETAGINKFCACEYQQLDSGKDFPSSVHEKFDVVICIMAFHHFPNPKEAMKRLFGTCKPHGKLFVLDIVLTADSTLFHPENVKKECNYEGNLDGFEVESFKKELIDVGFLNAAAEKFTFKKESEKEGKTLMIDYDMFVICAEKN